ncbi:MAG: hypothetical protein JWP59_3756 [Massilia sp.]|nr:hypothetical protein [Massilia sp.]
MVQKITSKPLAATTAFDDLEIGLDAVPEPVAPGAGVKKKPVKRRVTKPADTRKRRFIDVPFSEKDEAKALGARFNGDARLWYVPKGVARNRFPWPDKEISPGLQARLDDIDKAKAAAEAALAKPPKKAYRPKYPDGYRASKQLERDMNLRFDFMMASDN